MEKIVDLDWLERALGLADGSAINFFALVALILGVYFIQSAERPRRLVAYAFFVGAFLLVGTSILTQVRHEIYPFVIVDTSGESNKNESFEIVPEAGLHQTVWSKVRDTFGNYQMIWVKEGKFYNNDSISVTFLDNHPDLGSRSRIGIPWCDHPGPQFRFAVEDYDDDDTGELSRRYALEPVGFECNGGEAASASSGQDNVAVAAIIPVFGHRGRSGDNDETILAQLGGLREVQPSHLPHTAAEIALRYYLKRADGTSVSEVANSFDDAVFGNETLPSSEIEITVRVTPIHSRSQDLPTNALWYGREVPRPVALKVAKALVEAGVELRYVGPYVFGDTRLNTIEVGYSRRESTKPVLSVQEIEAGIRGVE
ncbi:MAG: hypothetical protein AAF416_15850 [Pseudomonadota bacterium]